MTLDDLDPRDVFAMLAMQGMLADSSPESTMTYGDIARQAYIMADLMLKARNGNLPD